MSYLFGIMQATIQLDPILIPFIVSFVGVGLAILERGWKQFKDEQATNPGLKFGSQYVWNIVLSAGGVGAILGIAGAIIGALTTGELSMGLTLVSIVAQLTFGYLATYRLLDGLNKATDKKIAANKPTSTTNP